MNIPAVECARPMCFRVPSPDTPYNIGGTCFVIRFRDRLWAVTAKHVLTKFAILPSQVLIPYQVGGYNFFPISDAFSLNDYPTDSDCTDILIFEIDEPRIETEHFDVRTVYDLDAEPEILVHPDSLLAVHGFPTALNYADFDAKVLIIQRSSIAGRFGKPSQMTGCREVDLLNDGGVSDHDGFSGCPVFLASSEFGQPNPSKLIGVNLRGSATNRKKYYLDVFALKFLIDYHLEHGALRPDAVADEGD